MRNKLYYDEKYIILHCKEDAFVLRSGLSFVGKEFWFVSLSLLKKAARLAK